MIELLTAEGEQKSDLDLHLDPVVHGDDGFGPRLKTLLPKPAAATKKRSATAGWQLLGPPEAKGHVLKHMALYSCERPGHRLAGVCARRRSKERGPGQAWF